MNEDIEQLKYPIGHFKCPDTITKSEIINWIRTLDELPAHLTSLVRQWSDEQLDTPYRPAGWTVRQLIHHISDSHHNSYMRFKWALTENKPTIKAYDEKAWAALFDSRVAPIQLSLDHLSGVHGKLVYLLKGLETNDLQKTFIHPSGNKEITLAQNIGQYAWHSNHHFAHIANLAKRKGWE